MNHMAASARAVQVASYLLNTFSRAAAARAIEFHSWVQHRRLSFTATAPCAVAQLRSIVALVITLQPAQQVAGHSSTGGLARAAYRLSTSAEAQLRGTRGALADASVTHSSSVAEAVPAIDAAASTFISLQTVPRRPDPPPLPLTVDQQRFPHITGRCQAALRVKAKEQSTLSLDTWRIHCWSTSHICGTQVISCCMEAWAEDYTRRSLTPTPDFAHVWRPKRGGMMPSW